MKRKEDEINQIFPSILLIQPKEPPESIDFFIFRHTGAKKNIFASKMCKELTFAFAVFIMSIFIISTSSFKLSADPTYLEGDVDENIFESTGQIDLLDDDNGFVDYIDADHLPFFFEEPVDSPAHLDLRIRKSRHAVAPDDDGKCIIGDACGLTEYNWTKSCPVSRDHTQFDGNPELLNVLSAECPELFARTQKGDKPQTCCTPDDLIHMQSNVQMAKVHFSDCPSCANNLIELICHFRCAPNQDRFIEIEVDESGKEIESANYYVSKAFMEAMFTSCKEAANYTRYMQLTGCRSNCDTMDAMLNAIASTAANQFSVNLVLSDQGATDSVKGSGKKMLPADLLSQGSTCKK